MYLRHAGTTGEPKPVTNQQQNQEVTMVSTCNMKITVNIQLYVIEAIPPPPPSDKLIIKKHNNA
jgi:hypothetical protein